MASAHETREIGRPTDLRLVGDRKCDQGQWYDYKSQKKEAVAAKLIPFIGNCSGFQLNSHQGDLASLYPPIMQNVLKWHKLIGDLSQNEAIRVPW
jgi:hypothetical protein